MIMKALMIKFVLDMCYRELYWKNCRDMNRQPPFQGPMFSKFFGLAVGLAIISFGIVLSYLRFR